MLFTATIGVALALATLICALLAAIGLPGVWILALAAIGLEWWRPDLLSWWTIGGVLGIAVLSEVLEFISGALGATQAGGGWRSSVGAMIGGIAGAIAGTVVLAFLPLVGTIIGSVIGAGIGAVAGELTRKGDEGVDLVRRAEARIEATGELLSHRERLTRIGQGAAIGRALSVVIKGVSALAMGVWITIAAVIA
ncbi:MAG: DUF456 domain-containing protein [Planctomycetota bacterium]